MAAVSGRWAGLSSLMGRSTDFGMETGPLDMTGGAMSFEPDVELHDMVGEATILCVGAGGLGCEILKDLALTGFKDVHVIDLDTIDLTNLNRQFLFRAKDIGRPKAEVAAEFINARVPGCTVTPHFGKLQDFDAAWYKQFSLVVAGLDNIEARRWLNETLCSLVGYSPHADLAGTLEVDRASVIPMIDGGTEGLKGQARVILPKLTSCFECTNRFMPETKGKAMCTLENNPRQPDDCAMYVYVKSSDPTLGEVTLTNNESVFVGDAGAHGIVLRAEGSSSSSSSSSSSASAEGATAMEESSGGAGGGAGAAPTYEVKLVTGDTLRNVPSSGMLNVQQQWARDFGCIDVDKDSRAHMTWLHERAAARAAMFQIAGLTYEKTMGAIKNIIPAVASTNAVIAAACVHEAYKCLTMRGQLCNTYWLYNGTADFTGVDSNVHFYERYAECDACREPKAVQVPADITVQAFVDNYINAQGMFDKLERDDVTGEHVPVPMETSAPQLYNQGDGLFYVTSGPLAANLSANFTKPLKDFVGNADEPTVVKVSDKQWGKKFRHVEVVYI